MTKADAVHIRHEAIRRARQVARTAASQAAWRPKQGVVTRELFERALQETCSAHAVDLGDPALQELLAERQQPTA
ncbi:hypothetical protein ABT324_30835 [Saccharopolyspora sp. NPDC000359]|uniref:hypothetical protein n=1 Tax=Saccharopolyspora sp. NPDC000359 TaxID=3154251 RepID=UPI0033333207